MLGNLEEKGKGIMELQNNWNKRHMFRFFKNDLQVRAWFNLSNTTASGLALAFTLTLTETQYFFFLYSRLLKTLNPEIT